MQPRSAGSRPNFGYSTKSLPRASNERLYIGFVVVRISVIICHALGDGALFYPFEGVKKGTDPEGAASGVGAFSIPRRGSKKAPTPERTGGRRTTDPTLNLRPPFLGSLRKMQFFECICSSVRARWMSPFRLPSPLTSLLTCILTESAEGLGATFDKISIDAAHPLATVLNAMGASYAQLCGGTETKSLRLVPQRLLAWEAVLDSIANDETSCFSPTTKCHVDAYQTWAMVPANMTPCLTQVAHLSRKKVKQGIQIKTHVCGEAQNLWLQIKIDLAAASSHGQHSSNSASVVSAELTSSN